MPCQKTAGGLPAIKSALFVETFTLLAFPFSDGPQEAVYIRFPLAQHLCDVTLCGPQGVKLDHEGFFQKLNQSFCSFSWHSLYSLVLRFLAFFPRIFASSELTAGCGLSTIFAISDGARPASSNSLIWSRNERRSDGS